MKHSITIKGQTFELTTDEAKKLYLELKSVFGSKEVIERPFPVSPPEPMRPIHVNPNRVIMPTRPSFSMTRHGE